jgi:hypothetical protein
MFAAAPIPGRRSAVRMCAVRCRAASRPARRVTRR